MRHNNGSSSAGLFELQLQNPSGCQHPEPGWGLLCTLLFLEPQVPIGSRSIPKLPGVCPHRENQGSFHPDLPGRLLCGSALCLKPAFSTWVKFSTKWFGCYEAQLRSHSGPHAPSGLGHHLSPQCPPGLEGTSHRGGEETEEGVR